MAETTSTAAASTTTPATTTTSKIKTIPFAVGAVFFVMALGYSYMNKTGVKKGAFICISSALLGFGAGYVFDLFTNKSK